MGIKFRCEHCRKKLNVKTFLAGRRGICPECGGKIRIPAANGEDTADGAEIVTASAASGPASSSPGDTAARGAASPVAAQAVASVSSASAPAPAAGTLPVATPLAAAPASAASPSKSQPEAISEAPHARWYVRPPTGGQYGPAGGQIMEKWLREGRVSADSLVWREGWSQWQPGGQVFTQLLGRASDTAGSGVQPELPTAAGSEDGPPPEIRTAGTRSTGIVHPRRKKSKSVALVAIIALSIAAVALMGALALVLTQQS